MDPLLQKHSPSIRISNKSRSRTPSQASSETSSNRTEKLVYGKNLREAKLQVEES